MAKEGRRLKFRAKNRIVEAVLLEKESFLTGQAKKGAYLLAFTQRKKGQSFEMILLHPGNKELRNTSMSSVAGAEVRTIFLQPPSAVEIVEVVEETTTSKFEKTFFFACYTSSYVEAATVRTRRPEAAATTAAAAVSSP